MQVLVGNVRRVINCDSQSEIQIHPCDGIQGESAEMYDRCNVYHNKRDRYKNKYSRLYIEGDKKHDKDDCYEGEAKRLYHLLRQVLIYLQQ